MSREEIQTVFQIHDIRQSRVYQEAREEGREEGQKVGIDIGIEKGVAIAIANLVAENKSAEEIAAMLGLNEKLVRRAMAGTDQN